MTTNKEAKIFSPKKLIEVALPLDDINAAAAREKSIRHGHPSTLHLWWARRPLAAARAVIFAQMVNDPGYQQGEGFKYGVNKKEAEIKREKLFQIIRDLVKWENTNNETVLNRARAAIKESWRETCDLNRKHPQAAELFNPEKLPAFHDPFAGGGAIPLEAQRLGLESYASDLNPVAVMINKAMIEIPPKFAGQVPVGPIPAADKTSKKRATKDGFEDWSGAKGLAEDVRRYGHWMREQAFKRIGHLYPKVQITDEMVAERPDLAPYAGEALTVIAWLWARTVTCPNPACGCEMPLLSSFVLSSKKGKEAYLDLLNHNGEFEFFVTRTFNNDLGDKKKGFKRGVSGIFECANCGHVTTRNYTAEQANKVGLGSHQTAVVCEGKKGRVYLSAKYSQLPQNIPEADKSGLQVELSPNPRDVWCRNFGLNTPSDLFTPRQLLALTTFSDLVQEARKKAIADYHGARASRPQKIHHRTKLPHYEAGEHPQHIVFRLADSIPQALLAQWQAVTQPSHASTQAAKQRQRFDQALDQSHGACYLQQSEIATIVANALRYFDGERYRLHSWTIMPNHVHVLVTPLHGNSLSSLVHSWKSYSAKQANQVLGRKGSFWQADYFDRAMRNEEHFERTRVYIEQNPVKAGLCEDAEAWQFGSAWAGGRDALAPTDHGARASRPQKTPDSIPLAEGGCGATAYGDALAVYLGFASDKLGDYNSSLVAWSPTRDQLKTTFGRQALPMVWDYAETNPFANAAGDLVVSINGIFKVLCNFNSHIAGQAVQNDAQTQDISINKVISTDPPYYDNIGYADLSDFFYVWMRRSLKVIYPSLFSTMAVPKAEELVATPYRHGSKEKAETFFLEGMTLAINNMAKKGHPAFPVSIYYAFKQSETKEGSTSSTGWETFLEAVIKSGFAITGTWPIRTERGARTIGIGSNALASSVVLICQKRKLEADSTPRRQFQRQLREQMPEALEAMIGGETGTAPIAPVDLAQAAIGPGMAIFSKYAAVLNQDGSSMSVHDALILINRAITDYLNPDGGNFDADTLFCDDWFSQYGWSEGQFGEADTLARAKGTSVDGVRDAGVIESGGGKVRLLKWAEYPIDWDPRNDTRTPIWEACHQMIRVLNQQGESEAGALLAAMSEKGESIRQLAYHLYTLCERKKWADEARAYNELIGAWHAIVAASHETGHRNEQFGMDV
ncbi:DUF1156 domain-containing protein [Candidatus Venteria ishoeyi]|uniref:REP-associated tyrosine transposase n=1 Tax=Candidatus Venteria ishoeyi TaxID=1899563 RepID=UPI0025A52457|nr:DUF1156 domain-containing protein [Candidatus Venteria ishoeyi]MDM8547201.1 DUF1156 domain-containing protein [Candidatus Venteria ishoeyi]